MTKEKRLIATNKTEEERDRLTEVWKKRIVSEKGYSETIAERIAEKVKSLDGEPFRLRIFSIGNQLYKLKNKQ